MGNFVKNLSDGGLAEEYELNRHLLPEVTFENSPQLIEIKLVKED